LASTAPYIDNPAYKGVWKPRKIPNPEYFEEKEPLKSIGNIAGIGFEIWSMQSDILFDNILLTDNESEAASFAKATYHVKKAVEDEAEKASKPADKKDAFASDIHKFKEAPLAYLRGKYQDFLDVAVHDPVGALKSMPETAAVIAGAIAVLVGLLGVLITLLSPSPKVVKAKAGQAVDATKKAAQDVKDAPIAEKAQEAADTVKGEVKKRTAAAKGKAAE